MVIFLRSFLCFNPRICKRCDHADDVPHSDKNVSIHASVKDATFAMPPGDGSQSVSIHASVKDATQFRGFSYKEIIVSIHASVKDATKILRHIEGIITFQSTHL